MWAKIRGPLIWVVAMLILMKQSRLPSDIQVALIVLLAVAALASATEARLIKVVPLILILGYYIQRIALEFVAREIWLLTV